MPRITVTLADGQMRTAMHVYQNHRHFEAASHIAFHQEALF